MEKVKKYECYYKKWGSKEDSQMFALFNMTYKALMQESQRFYLGLFDVFRYKITFLKDKDVWFCWIVQIKTNELKGAKNESRW